MTNESARIVELEAASEPPEEPQTVSEEPEGRGAFGRGAPLLVAALVRRVMELEAERSKEFWGKLFGG